MAQIDPRKVSERLKYAVRPGDANARCLPYPGSILGERSGRTDNTVADLVPCMVSRNDIEFMVVVMPQI
jgi:hypothetical protein